MRYKVLAAFSSVLLVLAVVWVGVDAINRAEDAQSWVDHSVRVRQIVRDALEDVLEAKLTQTGYLALGDTSTMVDARALRERTTRSWASLIAATADNPAQSARVVALQEVLEECVASIEKSLVIALSGDREAMLAFVRADPARDAFRRLREGIAEIREAEEILLRLRRADTYERMATARTLLISGGVLAFLLIGFVISRIRTSLTELESAHTTIHDQAIALSHRTAELERLVKELDQFAYVASHDLKAPLRAIASLAQWIAEDAGDQLSGEARDHLGLLMQRVKRMEALVEGVLAYARAGRNPMKVEAIDVGKLVREVIELLAPPPTVAVTVATPLPIQTASRVPFQQVWMNLIANALKHGKGDGGRIEVGARSVGPEIHFYVADDGPGIEPQFHERVFTLFQTLEARDRVEGTGIGLAVVKKLVEQQGGRVWIESAPGKGATFLFTYPPSPPLVA